MIRINQIKVPVTEYTKEQCQHVLADGPFHKHLALLACRELKVKPEELDSVTIRKQSIDARKKPNLFYVYTLDVSLKDRNRENKVSTRSKNAEYVAGTSTYHFQTSGSKKLRNRPIIIGSGPAGLFCAWFLTQSGYKPLILERGGSIEERTQAVEHFWENPKELDPNCNVQFGEGGAGTFSDGKLNTMVKDPYGRYDTMLKVLYEQGGPSDILFRNKPHIGTNLLRTIMTNMRQEMLAQGAEYRFHACVTDLRVRDGRLTAVEINHSEWIDTEVAVLAVGHSARDTFEMLYRRQVAMEPKPFAVGVRIQHPQEMIDRNQYGADYPEEMPASDYKLTAQCEQTGRGVYSFCMCPGGFVVNASSESGRLAINGMSNHERASGVANSALIVTVTPEDYESYGRDCVDGSGNPLPKELYGMAFQRKLEEAAYRVCDGRIPVQLYGDFQANQVSTGFGTFEPRIKGQYAFGNVREILPDFVSDSLIAGMGQFGRKIRGFDRKDAILAGVESRTSSPIRIGRTESFECPAISGLYPCGEGAGYAGGISSAAIDGMKVAEAIAAVYGPIR